jgi:hypothetical protein
MLCNCALHNVLGFIGVMLHMHDRDCHKTNFVIVFVFLWRQTWQALFQSSLSWAILCSHCPGTCLAFRQFHSASCILSSDMGICRSYVVIRSKCASASVWLSTAGVRYTHARARTHTQVKPLKQARTHTPFPQIWLNRTDIHCFLKGTNSLTETHARYLLNTVTTYFGRGVFVGIYKHLEPKSHSKVFNTGLSKKMDGIWNRYNLKSTGRIYTFGILKCSEKFKVLNLP